MVKHRESSVEGLVARRVLSCIMYIESWLDRFGKVWKNVDSLTINERKLDVVHEEPLHTDMSREWITSVSLVVCSLLFR